VGMSPLPRGRQQCVMIPYGTSVPVTVRHVANWFTQLLDLNLGHRARQLYKNISMLFLFPVKDGKLSTSVSATFNASCYG